MTTNIPTDDAFLENATAYGLSPNLWLRCRPIPLTTINITAGGNLFRIDHKPGHYTDAYTASVTGMQTVADTGLVDVSRAMICGLWRRAYGTERAIEADFNIRYQSGSRPTDGQQGDYHQSVGLWARVSGGTISGPGTRDEFHQDVDGYFFCQSYRGPTSHRYILCRCVAGVLTVIDDLEMTRTYDAGDNVQGEFAPRKLRLEVTGVGATVNIKVIRHAQGSDETIIDFDDTNAARIVAAGRCGLSLHMPGPYASSSSSAPSCLYVKIDDMTDPNIPVELMLDHFGSSRADRGGYRLTPTDNLSNQGRSMMCGWTGDTQGQDDSTRIHHSQLLSDVDNVGVGDVLPASNAFGWHISARKNEDVSAAFHRSMSVTMQTDVATAREVGMAGRFLATGAPFTDYSADRDTDKACYCVAILYSAAGAFTAELRSYRPGVAHVVMATAAATDTALATITFAVAFTLDFEIQTVDNARIVLRAKIGATAIVFTPATAGVSLSGEWIFDDRGVPFANFIGPGEGMFFDTAGAATTAHYVIFDTWTQVALSDVSGLAGTPDNLWVSVEMQSETFGLVGTLDVPQSWSVQESGEFLQNKLVLRHGSASTFARTRKNRRSWTIHATAITSAERASLEVFYEQHRGPEQPFNWIMPSGEAVFAKFDGDGLSHGILVGSTEAFAFDLIEVFADPSQGTFPDVGWDATVPDNVEASGPAYWKVHREDGHINETYTVRLSGAAPIGGTTVAYLLGGDAIESTDYAVAAGASPLTIAAGGTTATVTINFLGNTSWHHERLLTLTIAPQGSSQIRSITQDEDQLRIYIQPDSLLPSGGVTPPIINFDGATSTYSGPGSGGAHLVPLTITPDTGGTDEDVLAYYTVTGTATVGADYRFNTSIGDELVDVSGGNTGNISVAVTGAGAASGRTVILTLNYEASGGGDMNLANNTHVNTFEHPDGYLGTHAATGHGEYPFPADSGPHTDGDADAVLASTGGGVRPTGLFTDPLHRHPDTGLALTGGFAVVSAPSAGFLESSRENEIFCDGPEVLTQFDDYQRFSICVVPPSAGSGLTKARMFRMEIYNENTGSEFAVHWDSESTTGGLLGGGAVADSFGNSWGINSFSEHYGLEGGVNNDFGVDVSVTGVTRLWFVYHEDDVARHATNSHRHVRKVWPSPWGIARYNASGGRLGGNLGGTNAANHWNEGWLFYDPMVERSGTILSGAPGQFWPRAGHYWRPRGNCLQGVTTVTHTVTL